MKTPVEASHRRRRVRLFAAAMAAIVGLLYLLIGLSFVQVVQPAPGDSSAQLYFGLPAALAFLFGACLLLLTDHRWLWVLGAILQVLVMSMYFAVAPTRVPSFELWGVLIRIAQVPLLIALAYLAATPQVSTIADPAPATVRAS